MSGLAGAGALCAIVIFGVVYDKDPDIFAQVLTGAVVLGALAAAGAWRIRRSIASRRPPSLRRDLDSGGKPETGNEVAA